MERMESEGEQRNSQQMGCGGKTMERMGTKEEQYHTQHVGLPPHGSNKTNRMVHVDSSKQHNIRQGGRCNHDNGGGRRHDRCKDDNDGGPDDMASDRLEHNTRTKPNNVTNTTMTATHEINQNELDCRKGETKGWTDPMSLRSQWGPRGKSKRCNNRWKGSENSRSNQEICANRSGGWSVAMRHQPQLSIERKIISGGADGRDHGGSEWNRD